MSTYLCFNIPQHGNVNPTLAIVQGLITRGEQATYYLTPEFRDPIEATGALFRSYTSSLDFNAMIAAMGSQSSTERYLTLSENILQECRALLPHILNDLQGLRPDGIIYGQAALWGRLLAQIMHVPAISVRSSYAINQYFQLFAPSPPTLEPEKAEQNRQRRDSINDQLNSLCREYHITPFDFTDIFSYAEPLTLVTMPRTFQYAGNSFDNRFKFVGPCILPRKDNTHFPLEHLGNHPLLYISLGTSFNNRPKFYQVCLNAFANTPWQVVMATGTQVTRAELGPIPENFIVQPYVPQLEILARTSIFINHGGMNSTMEALSFGVPLISVPQIQEHELTARRVVELGLGMELGPELVTAESLQMAVANIAHQPEIRMRTRQMQHIIAETGGVHAAVDAILQYLHTRQAYRHVTSFAPKSGF
ncbi:putative UDP-glucosyltransferase YjiC [Dictyobacter alpinus]|uniref:Putative UDP-glucosyltransferase YjiC n=1 Tax=Dictyobacter alpinus TaxID=2014873 RepID=A0A402BJA6_9CHLR|nr:macrolide family glycosyltransferase [Dictyobacter alpinus]GCE31424.1 putative UDP-glucosyltransferase YjiC [Dictyobacter alpinus]